MGSGQLEKLSLEVSEDVGGRRDLSEGTRTLWLVSISGCLLAKQVHAKTTLAALLPETCEARLFSKRQAQRHASLGLRTCLEITLNVYTAT